MSKVKVGTRITTRDRWQDIGHVAAIEHGEALIYYENGPGFRWVNLRVVTVHPEQTTAQRELVVGLQPDLTPCTDEQLRERAEAFKAQAADRCRIQNNRNRERLAQQ